MVVVTAQRATHRLYIGYLLTPAVGGVVAITAIITAAIIIITVVTEDRDGVVEAAMEEVVEEEEEVTEAVVEAVVMAEEGANQCLPTSSMILITKRCNLQAARQILTRYRWRVNSMAA